MTLNTTIDRYARQITLPQIGIEGQKRLSNSKILCIGAGGLGSPALLYLAGAGIGTIGIVDPDLVEISNLQRQILFSEQDIGKNKAVMAVEKLRALNSSINLRAYPESFTANNAENIFAEYDIILDGTDNFAAKFLINDAAVKFGKPVISASLFQFAGQLAVFDAARGPCYRCVYAEPPQAYVPNCAEAGILGAVAGWIGTMQAIAAIQLALGLDDLYGKLWLMDGRNLSMRAVEFTKNTDCPVCSIPKNTIRLPEEIFPCAIPVIGADKAQAHDRIRFIDVREKEEFAAGHIPNAVHIPLSQIQDSRLLQQLNPSDDYIVYCQRGVRSAKAATLLQALGFTHIQQLEGGIERWAHPLQKE